MATQGVFVTLKCHVVRFIPCNVVIGSDMGVGLITVFKRSNYTSLY
jgi:hypothetical protein